MLWALRGLLPPLVVLLWLVEVWGIRQASGRFTQIDFTGSGFDSSLSSTKVPSNHLSKLILMKIVYLFRFRFHSVFKTPVVLLRLRFTNNRVHLHFCGHRLDS